MFSTQTRENWKSLNLLFFVFFNNRLTDSFLQRALKLFRLNTIWARGKLQITAYLTNEDTRVDLWPASSRAAPSRSQNATFSGGQKASHAHSECQARLLLE
jgi:hypothetical protein